MTEEATLSTPARQRSKTDAMTIADAYSEFGVPSEAGNKKVCLLRPYSVFSKNSYSTPIVPPIGVTYLASVVEQAGYAVDVIDAVGEDVANIRLD